MAAKEHISRADKFAYAEAAYQQTLEEVSAKFRPMLEAALARARKGLQRQGINLSREQIKAYYKRQKQKPAQPTPEQEAERKEWARKNIMESADLLSSARNACEGIEKDGGDKTWRYDHLESSRFARLAIEETGRILKEHLGKLGVEFKPSFLE